MWVGLVVVDAHSGRVAPCRVLRQESVQGVVLTAAEALVGPSCVCLCACVW